MYTVKQMKEILANYPDDLEVAVWDRMDGRFIRIEEVDRTDEYHPFLERYDERYDGDKDKIWISIF